MKVIITGMNGTVAPVVAEVYRQKGYEVVAYDRSITSIDNETEIKAFIKEHNPKIILHLALGPISWSEILSSITKELEITFVYISSVSVYSNDQKGPFVATDTPYPVEDYGIYKKASEEAIKAINPDAFILRIGWQIGHESGSNNMIDFFQKQMDRDGIIKASSKFYPSCSFIEDTALAIYEVVLNHVPDTYLVNSNHNYNLFEIATYLKRLHPLFRIKETTDFSYDNRMFDIRVPIKKLSIIP